MPDSHEGLPDPQAALLVDRRGRKGRDTVPVALVEDRDAPKRDARRPPTIAVGPAETAGRIPTTRRGRSGDHFADPPRRRPWRRRLRLARAVASATGTSPPATPRLRPTNQPPETRLVPGPTRALYPGPTPSTKKRRVIQPRPFRRQAIKLLCRPCTYVAHVGPCRHHPGVRSNFSAKSMVGLRDVERDACYEKQLREQTFSPRTKLTRQRAW
jgi:hypothetical protein